MITIDLEVFLPFRGQRMWQGQEAIPAGLRAGDLPAYLGIGHLPELVIIVDGRAGQDEKPIPAGAAVAILLQTEGG